MLGLHLGLRTARGCNITAAPEAARAVAAFEPVEAGDQRLQVCAGAGEGLVGEYFGDAGLEKKLFANTDAGIDFEWAAGVPGSALLTGDPVAGSEFGVVWSPPPPPYSCPYPCPYCALPLLTTTSPPHPPSLLLPLPVSLLCTHFLPP